MINWKVRVRNKSFWLTLVPAVALFAQAIASCFDVSVDLGEQTDKIMAVVNTLFVVLGTLGLVNDPTTAGLNDSDQAMSYTEPKPRDINGDGNVDERDIDELLRRIEKIESGGE